MPRSGLPVASPPYRRVIATAFDTHYFRQGLNLIASLHRTSLGAFDALLVYSLGLTEGQRTCLERLERVVVVDFPPETRTFYPEYLHPKSHAYKCAAIHFAADHVAEGEAVLWMDAGVAALQSVDEIFACIKAEDVFFVNHDDSGFWPFYNVMFTHPRSLELLGATSEEMMAPHLCSCLLGYKKDGRYHALFKEAYRYSQTKEIVIWPKHRGSDDNEKPRLNRAEGLFRQALERAPLLARTVSRERLTALFGYYGHTGDQPIYSVLAARYGCTQHSARRYNRSNAHSHEASKKNWHSGAESPEIVRSRYHLDKVTDEVVILHHRGTYDNLDGFRLRGRQPVACIVGNAADPGRPDETCTEADIIGIDDGFARWTASGHYPTYYCCLDETLLARHGGTIARLANEYVRHGIRLFLLRRSILATQPVLAAHPAVLFWEDYRPNTSLLYGGPVTSAPFAARLALALGYRDVRVFGVDPTRNAEAWSYLQREFAKLPARLTLPQASSAAPLLSAQAYKEEIAFWHQHILADIPPTIRFKRKHKARLNEHVLLRRLLEHAAPIPGQMVDVGAHVGNSMRAFAHAGWRVLAFEPDPDNRQALAQATARLPTVTVDPRAVGDQAAEARAFYTSAESSGASSLLAFTTSHTPSDTVQVTTLRAALQEHDIHEVDFLKIDAEGFDLMALRGFPWERMRPAAVLCEFEDRKTQHLGYTVHDLAAFLLDQGYTLLVSEWHPTLRYGIEHDWRALKRYPCSLDDPDAWGNLIALREPPDPDLLRLAVRAALFVRRPSVSGLRRLGYHLKRRLRASRNE